MSGWGIRTEAIHFIVYRCEVRVDIPESARLYSAPGYISGSSGLGAYLLRLCQLTRIGLGDKEEDDALLRSKSRDIDVLIFLVFERQGRQGITDINVGDFRDVVIVALGLFTETISVRKLQINRTT